MSFYAHTTDLLPRRLPRTWADPATNLLHMGLPALSAADLAALGWYPVRREPLNDGASGYGPLQFDEAAQEYVIPSLPADSDAALQQWRESASVPRLNALIAIEDASTGFVTALNDAEGLPLFPDLAAQVQAWASDPARTLKERAYFDSTQWRRLDPLLISIGIAFGLSELQLDALVKYAQQTASA